MSDLYPPSVIIVAIESMDWELFRVFVRKLHINDRLAQIVVDKSQLTLIHAEFWPVMGTLKWLGGLGLQIIQLTATLPPSLEQDLFDVFGITSCYILQTAMPRSNISYNVVRSEDTNLDGTICEEYKKAITRSATD